MRFALLSETMSLLPFSCLGVLWIMEKPENRHNGRWYQLLAKIEGNSRKFSLFNMNVTQVLRSWPWNDPALAAQVSAMKNFFQSSIAVSSLKK